MYSIVMLSALAPGADVTPAPAAVAPGVVVGGCTGSCLGYAPAGSCYGSYAAGGCHGSCHGGHFRARAGGFLGQRAACHGGGYSCSGFNCFGSCYGSYIAGYASCHGCHGAFAYGSSWGPAVGMAPYTLHGYNSTVWGAAYAPGAPVMAAPGVGPNPPPVMTVPVAPMTKPAGSDGQGANLKFSVPADAKLFVDGKPTAGTGTERTFFTPPLAPGQKFFYDVKVELVVDGKTVTDEKRVIVESGATVSESFPKLVAAAAAVSAVAGK